MVSSGARRRVESLGAPRRGAAAARRHVLALVGALLLALCVAGSADAARPSYRNPVLAGDWPDPSAIHFRGEFFATATSTDWAPIFPILRSRDLVNWTIGGQVFSWPPAWTGGRYWAPEITRINRAWLVHYTARRRGGKQCIGAATALTPTGPYVDRGPIVCEPAIGHIDGTTIRDEHGRLFLVWKEDAVSVDAAGRRQTRLWAQHLSEGAWEVVGPRAELFRNDVPWEGEGIEAPFLVRRGGWFYAFYSGNRCCGLQCSYAMGVARSRSLFGRWEKYPGNPILAGAGIWLCPGHGTMVTDARRRDWMVYHSYSRLDFTFAGRKMMLDRVTWSPDGWPSINGGRGPSVVARSPFGVPERGAELRFRDDFEGRSLRPGWQWPHAARPGIRLRRGGLLLSELRGSADPFAAVLGWPTTSGRYVARTAVDARSLPGGALAGLAAYGSAANAIAIGVRRDGLVALWARKAGQDYPLVTVQLRRPRRVELRLSAVRGARYRFAFSIDGRRFRVIGEGLGELAGDYLPPGDRGVRAALFVGGKARASAAFDFFRAGH